MNMNVRQARVIDPIVTAVARGFRPAGSMLASLLFPVVPVAQRGGQIIVFGADDFKLVNSARAPGANTKRVQFGYGATPFALVDYSLEAQVPTELQQEGLAVPGINNITIAVRRVQNLMALERENQAAVLARNAGAYAAGSIMDAVADATLAWTNPNSDPIAQIQHGREVVRQKIGVRPNSLGLSPHALTALRSHPKLIARVSVDSLRTPLSLEQLKAVLELENVQEGEAVTSSAAGGFADVWGDDAVLAYTTPASMQDMGSPNYGYTYQLEGHPFVEPGYGDRNSKSFIYPVTDARQPVLAGVTAGYLFKGVGVGA